MTSELQQPSNNALNQSLVVRNHSSGGGRGSGSVNNNNNFVIVELHRDDHNCPSFGFNIKGGIESGCPVYIWRVEQGSLADRSGLKSGDEIVQANGISFNGISHAEALKVLKGQTSLTLYIKAPLIQGTPRGARVTAHEQMMVQQQHQQQQPIPLPPPLPPLPPPLPPPQQQQSQQLVQQQQQCSVRGDGSGGNPQSQSPHHRVEYYTWVDRHGNPVPPPLPTNYAQSNRLINLEISPGQNLGLMIRGGSEYGLGIYVTGVDPGSVAERVGLTRGDEILSVNNKNFTRITHDKAVQILKSSKRMQIVATYIGKIPADLHDGEDLLKLEEMPVSDSALMAECEEVCEHDTVIVDPNLVDEDLQSGMSGDNAVEDARALDLDFVRGSSVEEGVGGRCTTSILQMIEEKARTVLNKSEHSRFTFYRIEYMQGFLPVVAFVRILLELLNTHEKYTLLTEVRELIRPPDLSQFDELIYSKSTHFRVSSNPANNPSVVVPPPNSATASASAASCTNNTRSIFEVVGPSGVSREQTTQQPQQPAVPPQLPPPPQPPPTFLHCHSVESPPPPQQQQQPDEIIMDDFIDQKLMPAPGGSEECCFGGTPWGQGSGGLVGGGGGGGGCGVPPQGAPQQQQQLQQQQQRFINPGNCSTVGIGAGGGGGGGAGGVLATDNRQLLITHDPAALTMQVPPQPSCTTTPSIHQQQQQPRNILPPPITTASSSTAAASQLLTPNKLATAPTTPGGTLQQGVSNHVLPPPIGSSAPANGSTSSSVPAVRFKVRITKVKPILGIAIEGGSNTPHRLPRIIDVNPDGSAFHSNLRAGQVLLTVDGKKLDGLTHEEIARLILDCYVDMTKSQIEFLVVEAKQNYYYFNNQQSI